MTFQKRVAMVTVWGARAKAVEKNGDFFLAIEGTGRGREEQRLQESGAQESLRASMEGEARVTVGAGSMERKGQGDMHFKGTVNRFCLCL